MVSNNKTNYAERSRIWILGTRYHIKVHCLGLKLFLEGGVMEAKKEASELHEEGEVEVNESEKLPDSKDNKQWELVEKMTQQVGMVEAFENEK